jgi:hypothetical protein
MADRPKSEKERREERLEAALRENLRRRKAQARGRAGIPAEPAQPANPAQPAEPHDSAGIAADKESG